MPEHFKALVVILVLATAVFAIAKKPACPSVFTVGDFNRRRYLWIGIVLIAFFAHNYWLYVFFAGALLLRTQAKEPNKLALYFSVLLALPAMPTYVPGLGLVNALFEVTYIRLLALTVLLPAYLHLRRQPGIAPFGQLLADKFIVGYLILSPLLALGHLPVTGILRIGLFYPFVDIFLPYYVASRCLRDPRQFRDALAAFVVAALILSAILVFESQKHWLLYSALETTLGLPTGGQYLARGANLRAPGTAGHAIAAGFVIAVAMGIFLYVGKSIVNPKLRGLVWLVLAAGLLAPVSRGPWVGASAMLLIFIATGRAPVTGFAKLALFGAVALPFLLLTPMGATVIDHLPFIGTVESGNVDARKQLSQIAFQAMMENPFFGRFDFIEHPLIQAFRGTDGLIDLVNTYAVVVLSSGLVGLSMFAGCFIAIAIKIYAGMRGLADRNSERYLLGQALIATLIGILIIIATVSPLAIIPAIHWSIAGVGIGYAHILESEKNSALLQTAHSGTASVKVAS